MRIFVTWLLAFGMIVSPAMAGTDGAGDAKNTTASNTTNTTTAADKDKAGDTTAPASKHRCGKAGTCEPGKRTSATPGSHRGSIQAAASAKRATEGTAAENASAGERSQLQQRS